MSDTYRNLNEVLKAHGVKPITFEPVDAAQSAQEKIQQFREKHGLLVAAAPVVSVPPKEADHAE